MPSSSGETNTDQESQSPIPQKEFALGTMVSESGTNLPDPNHVVVDNAIEVIGMGRYQWNLTVPCGFGFVGDRACRG